MSLVMKEFYTESEKMHDSQKNIGAIWNYQEMKLIKRTLFIKYFRYVVKQN